MYLIMWTNDDDIGLYHDPRQYTVARHRTRAHRILTNLVDGMTDNRAAEALDMAEESASCKGRTDGATWEVVYRF